MDKERLLGLMEVVFLVFGRMISEYKERWSLWMEQYLLEVSKTIKCTVLEDFF